jgi:hypothetical protein
MYKEINRKNDLIFGFKSEDLVLQDLKKMFGSNVKKTPQYHQYDYIVEGIIPKYIELKTRRNSSIKYDDTMMPKNKLDYADKNDDKEFYFFFKFTDGLFYQKYNKDYNYNIREAGRCDRGKEELKQYGFVKSKDLICCSK